MSHGRLFLAAFATLGLAACSTESPQVRMATSAEAQSILEPLLPGGPKGLFCVDPAFRPPLADQRQYAAWDIEQRKSQDWWTRVLRWVDSSFAEQPSDNAPKWAQPNTEPMGESRPLREEDSSYLDELLQRAVQTGHPNGSYSAVLPASVAPCTKQDLAMDPSNGHDPIMIFYSMPVVVGNVAYVEVGSVCGGLCGSGHLTALLRKDGKWTVIGEKATWIS
jgi:hypothetical protein